MVIAVERTSASPFKWAVPDSLNVPPDPLRCRLDFHYQAVVMTLFDGESAETRMVSAMDVAQALASDLSFSTGLLPPNTLWWQNTKRGPLFSLYVEPKVRILALEEDIHKPPRRFTIPLPGLIFLCSPGVPPWVYAVAKKPTKESDTVFRAPLCNVHDNGRSCAGTHTYPQRVADIPQSFFVSFFTASADIKNRSKSFPNNVVALWESLENKKYFPRGELVRHGTIKDLLTMAVG